MFEHELGQVQAMLNQKAEVIEREFNAIDQALQALNQKIKSTSAADRVPLITEREELYAQQSVLVAAAKGWRDWARRTPTQNNKAALRVYLHDLLAAQDGVVRPTVEAILRRLDAPIPTAGQLLANVGTLPAGGYKERLRAAYEPCGQSPASRPDLTRNVPPLTKPAAVAPGLVPFSNAPLLRLVPECVGAKHLRDPTR